jgi:hypothetical protein
LAHDLGHRSILVEHDVILDAKSIEIRRLCVFFGMEMHHPIEVREPTKIAATTFVSRKSLGHRFKFEKLKDHSCKQTEAFPSSRARSSAAVFGTVAINLVSCDVCSVGSGHGETDTQRTGRAHVEPVRLPGRPRLAAGGSTLNPSPRAAAASGVGLGGMNIGRKARPGRPNSLESGGFP